MLFAVTAASAIVPSLLLMWFFHARDVYREPPKVLWATFGFGVLTIPGVLLVVLPLVHFTGIDELSNPYMSGFVSAFGTAAIPEELFKFLVVFFYCSRHKEFDEPMDGVVYGAVASLGFATLENVLYVASGGLGVAIMRAFTAVPGHAFCGAIMGYYVGQAKFRPAERGKLLAASLFWPILLHGLYDFPLLTMKAFGEGGRKASSFDETMTIPLLLLFLAALIVETVWALRAAGRLRKEQLVHQRAMAAAGQPHPMQPPAQYAPGAPPMGTTPHAPGPAAPAPGWGVAPPTATPQWGAGAAAPPPYGARPVLPTDSKPSTLKGWLMLIPGVLLAAFGGLMTLGLALAVVFGDDSGNDLVPLIGGGIIIGLLPLLAGVTLFGFGIRALNGPR